MMGIYRYARAGIGCALALTAAHALAVEPSAATEVTRPDWLPPTTSVMRIYPPKALIAEKSGKVTLRCSVSESFGVTSCKVMSENPRGYGFGAAAIELVRSFRMKSATLDDLPVVPGMIVTFDVPFRLE